MKHFEVYRFGLELWHMADESEYTYRICIVCQHSYAYKERQGLDREK